MDSSAKPSSIRSIIAALWKDILRRDVQVQGDDNFFTQGGDAIAAARLEQQIEDEFPVALRTGTVRDAPTLSQLTSSVDQQIQVCRAAYIRLMAQGPPLDFEELLRHGNPGAAGILGDAEFIARAIAGGAPHSGTRPHDGPKDRAPFLPGAQPEQTPGSGPAIGWSKKRLE